MHAKLLNPMLKLKSLFFLLALSATSLSAAPKPKPTPTPVPTPPPTLISSLPYVITAPGTYVLTGNLTATTKVGAAAISILSNIQGPVVLDLQGFTLTGVGPDTVGIGIGGGPGDPDGSNTFPITVKNGTIINCSYGVWAETGLVLNNITVTNLTISTVDSVLYPGDTVGILFSVVENSVVRNCTINQPTIGIQDSLSPGGNQFYNITMNNVQKALFVEEYTNATHLILSDCTFAAPVTP